MIIDIVIGIALLVAVFVGYRRGVIQPLLVEIGFLVALLVILRDRHAYADAMQKYLHANAVFSVFLALVVAVVAGYAGGLLGGMIHKMPAVRGVDGFLGIFVHAAFVVVASYILLSALVALDKAFEPTVNAATLTVQQVNQLRAQIDSNALTASLFDDRELATLQKDAATTGGAHISSVPQLDQVQTFYEQFVQPQLSGSRLAPVVMAIGHRIPVLGHAGPADLPGAASPARTSSPAPATSPSPKR